MFRSLPVADRVYRESTLPAGCQEWARDSITLGWEDRLKVRGRRRSDGGVEFGTSLPRGTVLRDGDCFLVESASCIVRVVEREEKVFVMEPKTASEWGLFAYHVGNNHQPLMLSDRGPVCPDDPGVEALLRHHRIPYVRDRMPFTPVSAVPEHRHS